MPREVVDGKTRAETGVKQRGEPQPRGAGKRYRGTKTSGASENVRVDVKNRRRTTPDDPGRVAHAGAALAYTYVEAAAPAVGAAVRLLRECPRHPPFSLNRTTTTSNEEFKTPRARWAPELLSGDFAHGRLVGVPFAGSSLNQTAGFERPGRVGGAASAPPRERRDAPTVRASGGLPRPPDWVVLRMRRDTQKNASPDSPACPRGGKGDTFPSYVGNHKGLGETLGRWKTWLRDAGKR